MPSLFLLGAGFNVDANAEVGPIYGQHLHGYRYQIDCGYPLVNDLWKICFGVDNPPAGQSIEQWFADAIERRDNEPLTRLYDRLMEADYRLASRLADTSSPNSYKAFFDAFENSSFMTFNYDSLPEIFLFRRGKWHPGDGFGVPVIAKRDSTNDAPPPAPSFVVLHLHGSLLIYEQRVEFHATQERHSVNTLLTPLDEARFIFDADSVGALFTPYRRTVNMAYKPVEQRVIAPVRNKATGLRAEFIRKVYGRAREVVAAARQLVVIGYSFSPHDKASYDPLAATLARSGTTVLIVAPDAAELVERLRREYRDIPWTPAPLSFRQWVTRGFPGL